MLTPRQRTWIHTGEWMFPKGRLLTPAEKRRYHSGEWLFPA